MFVNENHFSQGYCVRVANYELFNIVSPVGGVQLSIGTATYVKRGFNVTLAKVPIPKFIEICPIILDFPLFQIYLLQRFTYLVVGEGGIFWDKIILLMKVFPNFILAGDWNANHTSWNCRH